MTSHRLPALGGLFVTAINYMNKIHSHEGCEACIEIPAFARKSKTEVLCRHGKKWLYGASQEQLDLIKDSPALFDCSCKELKDHCEHPNWDKCGGCE